MIVKVLQKKEARHHVEPADGCSYSHTSIHACIHTYTATHRNTLQHTATHRNTPQHTATHCNTLSLLMVALTHIPRYMHAFIHTHIHTCMHAYTHKHAHSHSHTLTLHIDHALPDVHPHTFACIQQWRSICKCLAIRNHLQSRRLSYVCVGILQQHTATKCNTLQHHATRCNTLQHAATH